MREPADGQPVVEVLTDGQHVRLVCRTCSDRRRLPQDDLAVRVGVAAFVDEHAGCGPARISLPDSTARTAVLA